MIREFDDRLLRYVLAHASFGERKVDEFFEFVERVTRERTELPEMLSGKVVGVFLASVARAVAPKIALDIGTFTGYSAFSIAYGIYLSGSGGKVFTFEKDRRHIEIFREVQSSCPFEAKVELVEGDALQNLSKFRDGSAELVFVDADKENYPKYFDEAKRILRCGGVLIIDNALWGGSVVEPKDTESFAIDMTNRKVFEDGSFLSVILPVRDGLVFAVKVQ